MISVNSFRRGKSDTEPMPHQSIPPNGVYSYVAVPVRQKRLVLKTVGVGVLTAFIVFLVLTGGLWMIEKRWPWPWPQAAQSTHRKVTAVYESMPSQPAAVSVSHTPVLLGIPESLKVVRGSQIILDATVDGAYSPEVRSDHQGHTYYFVDPSGDNPVWLDISSKVGSDMGTARFAGHDMFGGINMPFNHLSDVREGDHMIVTVPDGEVTFVVDSVGSVDKAINFDKDEKGKIFAATCNNAGDKNVFVSGHLIS